MLQLLYKECQCQLLYLECLSHLLYLECLFSYFTWNAGFSYFIYSVLVSVTLLFVSVALPGVGPVEEYFKEAAIVAHQEILWRQGIIKGTVS